MAEEGEESKTYQYIVLLLGLTSLVMATAAVYLMEILGINYGAGLAIIGLANRANSTVSNTVTQIAAQVGNIHGAISETYLIAIISFGLLGASLALYISRYRRFNSMTRRYTLLHGTLTLVYIALFYLVLSSLQINYASPYFISVFSAIGATLLIDIYLQFTISTRSAAVSTARKGMRIEPGTPYTNLLNLRDTIFSKLQGDVRVVDKHFNSSAVSNLHRLLETNLTNIRKLEIISSKEMFDAKFNDNYTDFKNELRNKGVELNFMLMGDADSVEQHERFIFDDTKAYKIPPLNIINKKSEHIVGLRVGEARSRFEALMRNATKYDNYVVKQARGPG